MNMTVTLILLGISLVLAVAAFRMDAREPDPMKPRMIPWMIVALALIGFALMLLVNVVNLLGFETGRN